MAVQISRRSFLGASAFALALMTPLAGCSNSGSTSSSASMSADANSISSSSEEQEPITLSNCKWEHVDEDPNWLRCTGTITNNTTATIGRFDIKTSCKQRYTDKYGETVEHKYSFQANSTLCRIVSISGVASVRYGEYNNISSLNKYTFVDLRGNETVDFEYIIRPDDISLSEDGKKLSDVEFVDPVFEALVVSDDYPELIQNNKEKTSYRCDRFHDFDIEVIGGPALEATTLRITNNSDKYIDKGQVYYTVYNPNEGNYGKAIGYLERYSSLGLMKPGDTTECTLSEESAGVTLTSINYVAYHIDK